MSLRRLNSWIDRVRNGLSRLDVELDQAADDPFRNAYRIEIPQGSTDWAFAVQERDGDYSGELFDLNIRGVSAEFTVTSAPELSVGDTTDITIHNREHGRSIRTPARIAAVEKTRHAHRIFSFEFVSEGDLYAQLDEFYTAVFNRRSAERVECPTERRVSIDVSNPNQVLRGHIADLSTTGVGVWLPEDVLPQLVGIIDVDVSFQLWKGGAQIEGPAEIRVRRQTLRQAYLGLQFDLGRRKGIRRHVELIEQYVKQRKIEIANWEAGLRPV